MAPRAGFGGEEPYPSLLEKAAALTYALAKSQACADGNKRVALILLQAFLSRNGRMIEDTGERPAEMIRRAAESDPDRRDEARADLVEWLQQTVIPLRR